jgi:hypothetical protein
MSNERLDCTNLVPALTVNVRLWHKADIPSCTAHVIAFGGKADIVFAALNVR